MSDEIQPIRLIVGLGNPGSKYEDTRHNIGRDYINHLAAREKLKFSDNRQADQIRLPVFFGESPAEPIVCARLKSYMNESGPGVQALLAQEKIKPTQALIIVDDFMIPFGTLRLRTDGSSGGHNGLKSIIETLGLEDFPRLRVGIGPTPDGGDPADFVLKEFTKDELQNRPKLFDAISEGIVTALKLGFQKAMTQMNKSHL